MGFVSGCSRDQASLFPVVLDDLVSKEHLVRVIDAFVAGLDLAQLGFAKALVAATGRPPFDPGDLLRLYLYGYLNHVRSSRKLERECARNVELMWLLNGLKPDHKTIAEFRRCNAQPFKAVCAAFVGFCRQAKLLGGEWVAIDGSKFQADLERDLVTKLISICAGFHATGMTPSAFFRGSETTAAPERGKLAVPISENRARETHQDPVHSLARPERRPSHVVIPAPT